MDSIQLREFVGRLFLTPGDHAQQVHCPFCGHEYVRMKKPLYFTGGDYEAAKVLGLGVRGDVTVLSFQGECGHAWVLAFGVHKGQVFYDIVQDGREA